jgi:hypothetical protein
LECIHVTADTSVAYRLGSMKLYRETSHWHNHRKPLNPKQAPVQKVSKWRSEDPQLPHQQLRILSTVADTIAETLYVRISST